MTERSLGRYPIPAATHRVEETRLRSRFITTIEAASTVEEARAFVTRVSAEHADATHNCWAYVVGPPGDTSRVGMSDDGEPRGTAGRPMLAVLLGSGVGDIAAVVTRYYGGTKLGRGGLVRAYGGGVKLALEDLRLDERVRWVELRIALPYPAVSPLRGLLSEFEADVLEETYGTEATFRVRVPEERETALSEAVGGLTSGRARIEPIEPGTAG
jgi:uncharacterized YigZ family protein